MNEENRFTVPFNYAYQTWDIHIAMYE